VNYHVQLLRLPRLLLSTLRRLRRLSTLFEALTLHPAQTILFSFLAVILTGTLLLMLPFTTPEGAALSPLDALFTATSAVCVTGLIVADTAARFTLGGQIILLLLIQIGGLGIMIISYFSLFAARQKVSLEEKVLLSYILNERNMNALAGRVKSIILATFLIEGAGTLLLFPAMRETLDSPGGGIFYAIFHSVSAFCNAGFALFSDSLEGFSGDATVTLTVAALILLGGLSFSVIANLWEMGHSRLAEISRRTIAHHLPRSGSALYRKLGPKKGLERVRLSLNSLTVLRGTGILLIAGLLLFYLLEHTGVLARMPAGQQYLHALFQSVTLRTAGFNTVAIGRLGTASLLVMLPFMFIGAASGSTAGGIKINNVAIMTGYIRSVLSGRETVTIANYSIGRNRVNRAFLIFFFGIGAVGLATVILSVSETFALEQILFEAVSAFGTVGLSTGITGELSATGRLVIVVLMYVGRVGPLTILAAASRPSPGTEISYPRGEILV
jgi:trk system potassium uptake protein TrkH